MMDSHNSENYWGNCAKINSLNFPGKVICDHLDNHQKRNAHFPNFYWQAMLPVSGTGLMKIFISIVPKIVIMLTNVFFG